MYKKRVFPAIARLFAGVVAAAVAVYYITRWIADPEAKNIIWSVLFSVAGLVLIITGLSDTIRTLQFNKLVDKSGVKVKKEKRKTVGDFFKGIGKAIASFFTSIGNEFKDIVVTFTQGDWKTKLSYIVMGFGSIARGQVLRGILFLLFEIVFIAYMFIAGGYWLSMLPSLGLQGPVKEYDAIYDAYVTHYYDNSFKILLYGVLTIFFIIAFIYT